MEDTGVYVIRVASMLCGMHSQTLRKYERAGLISPSRSKMLRMYSDEDIVRLRMIKHLEEEVGLNLAGVNLVLKLQNKLMAMKEEMADTSGETAERLKGLIEEMESLLGMPYIQRER